MPMTQEERDAEDALEAARQAEYENTVKYIDDRKASYGSVEEQLEYLVENGVDAFIARQAAIKAQFPKPEEE